MRSTVTILGSEYPWFPLPDVSFAPTAKYTALLPLAVVMPVVSNVTVQLAPAVIFVAYGIHFVETSVAEVPIALETSVPGFFAPAVALVV